MCGPRNLGTAVLAVLASITTSGCSNPPPPRFLADRTAALQQEQEQVGALISMNMRSTVGVLLDEIPAGRLRDAAAARALAQDDKFWIERAGNQTRYASYRLVFRSGYYLPAIKGPLPLPPKDVWKIQLLGRPRRMTLGGHDFVATDYKFSSYIISDAASPAAVEPALGASGGTWDEPLSLPVDPELLLQRTGYACMNEFEFPPNSVFEENTWYYYDQTCAVETPPNVSCHLTNLPDESCVDALTNHTGISNTSMHFKRVDWDDETAKKYRVGSLVNPNGADLAVVQQGVEEERSILYRYFAPGSCEIGEGVIGKLGWRRLLTFSAVVRNDGTQPVHIGDPRDKNNPWVKSNVFEFSECHQHYHFSHYGTFGYAGAPGSKRAFCLEDTNRYHNDEITPLTAIHQSCEYQGIGAGWGDEYNFGLPGQWVDITDVDATTPHDLTFQSNPDKFLCEGTPLSANNTPVDPLDLAHLVFDPTSFRDANNNVVSRMRCDFFPHWDADNLGKVSFSSPGGSFVTDPCTRGQIGPLRDCGFAAKMPLHSCTPGQTVQLSCSTSGTQVLRVCEKSEQLGVGVACAYRDALANAVIAGTTTTVSFTCPAVRDTATAGTGGYSVYQAPLLPWQAAASISCTGW